MFGPCFVIPYLVSFHFAIILMGKRESCCFYTLIVFMMASDCLFSLAHPHGAVGWSAVCDCDISSSFSLNFESNLIQLS